MPAARQKVETRRLAVAVGAKRAFVRTGVIGAILVVGVLGLGMCIAPLTVLHDAFGETVRTRVRGAGDERVEEHHVEERSSPWLTFAARSAVFLGLAGLLFWTTRRIDRWAIESARTRRAREFLGELTIGRDGLRIRRYLKPEFVSYARLKGMEVSRGELILRLEGNVSLRLPAAEPKELQLEIEGARRGYAPHESPAFPREAEALLDARSLLSRSYRDHALTRDQLTDQACAMGAAPEARIAATLALARDPGPPSDLARIRASIEEMANEDLACAIETALLPDPDPALIDRALRA